MSYFKTFGLPVTISRCTNNYGPNQYPEKLIPLMVKNAKRNKELTVHGDGLVIRDWIYVDDNCEAIDLIVRQGKPGQIYNIGANCEKTNLEIVNLILKKLNKPKSLIKYVQDRLGQDHRYGIDASKIVKELGWESKYSFNTYIDKTISWYDKKY
jgi:dTDP-glucose 4,6-dehydratase